jgi:hypothetical protein
MAAASSSGNDDINSAATRDTTEADHVVKHVAKNDTNGVTDTSLFQSVPKIVVKLSPKVSAVEPDGRVEQISDLMSANNGPPKESKKLKVQLLKLKLKLSPVTESNYNKENEMKSSSPLGSIQTKKKWRKVLAQENSNSALDGAESNLGSKSLLTTDKKRIKGARQPCKKSRPNQRRPETNCATDSSSVSVGQDDTNQLTAMTPSEVMSSEGISSENPDNWHCPHCNLGMVSVLKMCEQVMITISNVTASRDFQPPDFHLTISPKSSNRKKYAFKCLF